MHVTRLLALAGLLASAVLLEHSLYANPALCGFDSGCGQVLSSPFGHLFGIPLPVFGALAFGAILAASLFPNGPLGRLRRPLSLAAGALGLGLICLQVFVIRSLCPLCLIADSAAVALAITEVARWARQFPPVTGKARPLWLGSAVLTVGLAAALGPLVNWLAGQNEQRPVPPEVAALWSPGKVNIVEVADFQCPHCRKMHAVLMQLVAEEKDNPRAHFIRITVPLPSYPQARHASRAFLCAQKQGKADEMAEALFAAPGLAPQECERLALTEGLSIPDFRACVASAETDRRLDADTAWVRAASPRGLPVIWVQDQMFFGLQRLAALRAAVRAAERRLGGPAE